MIPVDAEKVDSKGDPVRRTYRTLASIIPFLVVLQVVVIAGAWFIVLNDLDSGAVLDKNTVGNWAHLVHAQVGMVVIPLVALSLLIVSFFARVPGGIRWALIVLAVVVLQIVLAYGGFAVPMVGLLHGANAMAVALVAEMAARRAATTTPAAPAEPVAVS